MNLYCLAGQLSRLSSVRRPKSGDALRLFKRTFTIQLLTQRRHLADRNIAAQSHRFFCCGSGCEVLWWVRLLVCLSVCLSVCEDISGTTQQSLPNLTVGAAALLQICRYLMALQVCRYWRGYDAVGRPMMIGLMLLIVNVII